MLARQLVTRGNIVCPLSIAHASETSRWHDEKAREKAIELMLELSQGRVMNLSFDPTTVESVVAWAPSLLPAGTIAVDILAGLDHLSPKEQLETIFPPLARNVEGPANAFINRMTSDLQGPHDLTIQKDPSKAETPRLAWMYDLTFRRIRDPNRGVAPGDAFDLLHTCFAGFTDYGVVDRAHAILVEGSKYLPGRIFRRVSHVLEELSLAISA